MVLQYGQHVLTKEGLHLVVQQDISSQRVRRVVIVLINIVIEVGIVAAVVIYQEKGVGNILPGLWGSLLFVQ